MSEQSPEQSPEQSVASDSSGLGANAEAVARVHGEVFGAVRPVTSAVVVAALLDPEWLLEIEAHAVIGARLA